LNKALILSQTLFVLLTSIPSCLVLFVTPCGRKEEGTEGAVLSLPTEGKGKGKEEVLSFPKGTEEKKALMSEACPFFILNSFLS